MRILASLLPSGLFVSLVGLSGGGCDGDGAPGGGGSGLGGAAKGAGGQGGAYTLQAPVEVVRDTDGVVHLYGESDADVFYASGYMQATDRLFQMDLQRRRVHGRLAEVLGEGSAGGDSLLRTLNVPKWGRANAEAALTQNPDVLLVQAWVAGVNARIDEVLAGGAPMPLGFDTLGYQPERWEIADVFTIGKAIVFSNGNQLEFDVLTSLIHKYSPAFYASLPFYTPLTDTFILGGAAPRSGAAPWAVGPHPDAPAWPDGAEASLHEFVRAMRPIRPGASNNWAVGPALTDTGRSMIAGDPHQPLRSPSLMWLHHMNSKDKGGTFDVVGWSFVGTPGVSIGHNGALAWTATTNYPDVTDIWDVETDGDAVKVGDAWVPVTRREETVVVRGGEPRVVTIEEVGDQGVLLPPDLVPLPLVDAGHRLLFRWTGYRVTHEAETFLAFDRAQSLDDFDAAADRMELGSFNFVAASADGITYRSSPIVPDRGDPATQPPAYEMLDGSDASTLWTDATIPLQSMPHSRGETRGFIVSANNDPYGFTADGSLTNDPFYFGAYFDPGTRAGRIDRRLEELSAAGPITLEDMQAIQSDTHSIFAEELVPELEAAWAKVLTDDTLAEFRDRPELAALVALLSAWDLRMERGSTGAAAFEAYVHFYARAVMADDMSIFFGPVLDSSPTFILKFAFLATRDPSGALLQEGKDRLLLLALAETAEHLEARFGAVDAGFTWADVHRTSFGSESIPELDAGTVATDGAEGTVNVSEGRFFQGDEVAEEHVAGSGAIYRMTATFDPDGTPRAFYNMPGGASGEPDSPFWNDRTGDWVEDRYTLLRFKRAEVDAAALSRFVLAP